MATCEIDAKLHDILGKENLEGGKGFDYKDWTPNNLRGIVVTDSQILVEFYVKTKKNPVVSVVKGFNKFKQFQYSQIIADKLRRGVRTGIHSPIKQVLLEKEFQNLEYVFVHQTMLMDPNTGSNAFPNFAQDIVMAAKSLETGSLRRFKWVGVITSPVKPITEKDISDVIKVGKSCKDGYLPLILKHQGAGVNFLFINKEGGKEIGLAPQYYKADRVGGDLEKCLKGLATGIPGGVSKYFQEAMQVEKDRKLVADLINTTYTVITKYIPEKMLFKEMYNRHTQKVGYIVDDYLQPYSEVFNTDILRRIAGTVCINAGSFEEFNKNYTQEDAKEFTNKDTIGFITNYKNSGFLFMFAENVLKKIFKKRFPEQDLDMSSLEDLEDDFGEDKIKELEKKVGFLDTDSNIKLDSLSGVGNNCKSSVKQLLIALLILESNESGSKTTPEWFNREAWKKVENSLNILSYGLNNFNSEEKTIAKIVLSPASGVGSGFKKPLMKIGMKEGTEAYNLLKSLGYLPEDVDETVNPDYELIKKFFEPDKLMDKLQQELTQN